MAPPSHSTTTPPIDAAVRDFAQAVALGLTDAPRWVPARFLYDAAGSALFEQICQVPEYYLTRTEAAILARVAPEISRLTGPVTLIELGSGSSVKTDHLLRAYARGNGSLRYVPVDVSATVLQVAAERIGGRPQAAEAGEVEENGRPSARLDARRERPRDLDEQILAREGTGRVQSAEHGAPRRRSGRGRERERGDAQPVAPGADACGERDEAAAGATRRRPARACGLERDG